MTSTSDIASSLGPASATPGVRPGARPGARASAGRRLWPFARLASPIVLVALWQLLCSIGVLSPDTIASPIQVVKTAVDLIKDGTLIDATLISLQRAAIGFVLGAVIGIGLAIVAALSTLGELMVDPPLQMLRTLPLFGLIPLFIIWFGIDETPKIALITLGVLFPLYLNTFAGIRGIDRKVVEAARSMNMTAMQRLRHVVIPGALPAAFTGLRQSLGIAWLSLIVAETIAASSGLGYLINNAREFGQTDVVVVGLVVYALLGLITDSIVRLLERKALAWRV